MPNMELIKSQLLYQLSYAPYTNDFNYLVSCPVSLSLARLFDHVIFFGHDGKRTRI